MDEASLVTNVAAAFLAAWALGLLTYKIGLSPIVGYLLAGILIGPKTRGFVGDVETAQQLADIGVILLMFMVGLNFHFKDLARVKNLVVPCALIQSSLATLLGTFVFTHMGIETTSAMVIGMAFSVSSTVVLVRVFQENHKLNTRSGHVAVGWLVVEDIIAVIALILLPTLAGGGEGSLLGSIFWAMLKLALLVVVVGVVGSKIIPRLMVYVAKLRSTEMFTLTVLVFSVTLAVVSFKIFGCSEALGAFLAGMIIGQSPVSHQTASDVLPLKDAFSALFFVSAGMLFDPMSVVEEPALVISILAIILLVKPVVVFTLLTLFAQPARSALTVGLGLTQIGEFSFIMAGTASSLGLFKNVPVAHSAIIAAAILSITLNPLIFKLRDPIENYLKSKEGLWKKLNAFSLKRMDKLNHKAEEHIEQTTDKLAIVIGYGVVGQGVCHLLKESGIKTVVVDTNITTIEHITEADDNDTIGIYGDANSSIVLEKAGIKKATYLLITMPMDSGPSPIIAAARQLNPEIRIFARSRFVGEKERLLHAGATKAVFDEAETALAMSHMVIEELSGVVEETATEKIIDKDITTLE